jgi:hypothetical protein
MGKKKGKATKYMFLPKTSGLGIGEDSPYLYNPTVLTPIFNCKENLL